MSQTIVGRNVRIGQNARIKHCIIEDDVELGDNVEFSNCVIFGPDVRVLNVWSFTFIFLGNKSASQLESNTFSRFQASQINYIRNTCSRKSACWFTRFWWWNSRKHEKFTGHRRLVRQRASQEFSFGDQQFQIGLQYSNGRSCQAHFPCVPTAAPIWTHVGKYERGKQFRILALLIVYFSWPPVGSTFGWIITSPPKVKLKFCTLLKNTLLWYPNGASTPRIMFFSSTTNFLCWPTMSLLIGELFLKVWWTFLGFLKATY